uniref:Uncharacterized protein n=1 Tax=Lactuca sativa TaxID=4236 RepID=A0A9R1XC92_LACSA|nr:hypothetical protein LSAT_V11C500231050 [Lactuca sativa]
MVITKATPTMDDGKWKARLSSPVQEWFKSTTGFDFVLTLSLWLSAFPVSCQCASIEWTSPATLADFLGLDPSKRRNSRRNRVN